MTSECQTIFNLFCKINIFGSMNIYHLKHFSAANLNLLGILKKLGTRLSSFSW